VEIRIADFNKSDEIFSTTHLNEWKEVETSLINMPLHLKGSDQNKKVGSLIFDPVGTNAHLKESLGDKQWEATDIDNKYAFLGIDVDFAKSGIILEAQFSNYPFLLNNLLRSELFFREEVNFPDKPLTAVILVTKAAMFPASNSTLYYEQALNQLKGLETYNLFSVPLRLVGLFSPIDKNVSAIFTKYKTARYSRTIVSRNSIYCEIKAGRRSRCRITTP